MASASTTHGLIDSFFHLRVVTTPSFNSLPLFLASVVRSQMEFIVHLVISILFDRTSAAAMFNIFRLIQTAERVEP